jgi:SAM-dependent methyltransferase
VSLVFGHDYADAYDVVYSEKDYDAECDLIERIFQRHGSSAISHVLDLGCGTGSHALLVFRRGYEVVGVERSADMLARAQHKLALAAANGKLHFQLGDIRSVELGRRFDAALMMFAVLGYQLENDDVLAAVRTARRHLRAGGLFIFDFWYGPAVLHQRPAQRIKIVPAGEETLLRAASAELDLRRHLCRVDYHIWRLAGAGLRAETKETHLMRYFFPMEVKLFLECSGFELVRLGAFPDFDTDPDETTWNALGVARAV